MTSCKGKLGLPMMGSLGKGGKKSSSLWTLTRFQLVQEAEARWQINRDVFSGKAPPPPPRPSLCHKSTWSGYEAVEMMHQLFLNPEKGKWPLEWKQNFQEMFGRVVFSSAFVRKCSRGTETALDDWASLFCFRFINARRRIVQPMIDQSNRAGKFQLVSPFMSPRHKSSSSYPLGALSPGK